MYAIIDRQSLRPICHTKNRAELDKITSTLHIPIVMSDGVDAFKVFTTLELKMLYRNLGQVMGTNLQQRQSVALACLTLMKHIPLTSLDQQALFSNSEPAKSRPTQAGTGPNRQAANTVAPARLGGVRAIIWDHADKVWSAAGKPQDRSAVMLLRKQMMAELETQGVKKTSSSNELGNWMKARVP